MVNGNFSSKLKNINNVVNYIEIAFSSIGIYYCNNLSPLDVFTVSVV